MSLVDALQDRLPAPLRPPFRVRDTLELGAVGVAQIPMLAFIAPEVVRNDAEACRVRIRLGWRTGNHMGSMYFGVLCAGADVVSGMPVVRLMRERGRFLVPSFKDLHAEFLKRAADDVVFENDELPAITAAFERALETGERVNIPVRTVARMERSGEVAARFTTTLSMRAKPGEKLPLVQRVLAAL